MRFARLVPRAIAARGFFLSPAQGWRAKVERRRGQRLIWGATYAE